MSVKRTITSAPSQTLKAVLYDTATGDVWNTAGTPAFEVYAAGNIADYALAVTETSPGQYSTDVPATAPASTVGAPYKVIFYVQAGGSFATGDLANPAGTPDLFDWDGVLPTINVGDVKYHSLTVDAGVAFNSAVGFTPAFSIHATGAGGNPAVAITSDIGDAIDVSAGNVGLQILGGFGGVFVESTIGNPLAIQSDDGSVAVLLHGSGSGSSPVVQILHEDAGPALSMMTSSGSGPVWEVIHNDAGDAVNMSGGDGQTYLNLATGAGSVVFVRGINDAPAVEIDSDNSDGIQINAGGATATPAAVGINIASAGAGFAVATSGTNTHAIDLRPTGTGSFGVNIATSGDFAAGVQIDSSNSANAPGIYVISGNGSDFSPAVWLQSLAGTGPVLFVDGSTNSDGAKGISVASDGVGINVVSNSAGGMVVTGDTNGVFITGSNNLGVGISSHFHGIEIDTDSGGSGVGISITSDSVGVLVNSLTADALNVSPGENAIGLNINSSNLDGTAGIVVNGGSGSSALVLNGPDAAHDLVGHNGDLRVDFAATLLKLDLSTLSSPARKSLMNSLRSILNKWSITTGVRTVFAEDGSTPAFTETLTGTAGADPVTALTP